VGRENAEKLTANVFPIDGNPSNWQGFHRRRKWQQKQTVNTDEGKWGQMKAKGK